MNGKSTKKFNFLWFVIVICIAALIIMIVAENAILVQKVLYGGG